MQSESNMPKEEKISLKNMIQGFKEWLVFILDKRKKILYGALIALVLLLSHNYLKSPIHYANTSFVLENDASASLGSLSSLASMSGINTSSIMSASNLFQIDNIQELYRSNNMLKQALLEEVTINGKSQKLVDYFARAQKLEEKWAKKKVYLKDFYKDKKQYTRLQDSVLKEAIKLIKKDFLIVGKPNRNTSILNVGFKHKDEVFAKIFNEVLVNKVNSFYYKTQTKKTAFNLNVLQVQTDSVKHLLDLSFLELAEIDQNIPNLNPLAKTAKVPYQKAMANLQANQAIYLEVVKQLELAKVAHRNKTPLIQIIDKPSFPLENNRWTFFNTFIFGVFGGGTLIVLLLSLQRIIRQALEEQ
jgi:hypothetical protein